MTEGNKPNVFETSVGDAPSRLIPAPLGKMVVLSSNFVCFSPDFENQHGDGFSHTDACPHCVDTQLFDEVEEVMLTSL